MDRIPGNLDRYTVGTGSPPPLNAVVGAQPMHTPPMICPLDSSFRLPSHTWSDPKWSWWKRWCRKQRSRLLEPKLSWWSSKKFSADYVGSRMHHQRSGSWFWVDIQMLLSLRCLSIWANDHRQCYNREAYECQDGPNDNEYGYWADYFQEVYNKEQCHFEFLCGTQAEMDHH